MKNLSSAVRLTSTLSMLPVLLLSRDKSSSGGTPGSKKSCKRVNARLLTATVYIETHAFWTVFAKFKEVLIFLREGLINILQYL